MTATILNTATKSDGQLNHGQEVLALQMPSAWTAATIKFQVSQTDVDANYQDYCDDAGTAYTMTVAANGVYVTNPDKIRALRAWRYFRLVASVAQGADRESRPHVHGASPVNACHRII